MCYDEVHYNILFVSGGMKHATLATLWGSGKSDDFLIQSMSYVRCYVESLHCLNTNALQETKH